MAPRGSRGPPVEAVEVPARLRHPARDATLELDLACRDCGLCGSRSRVVVWRGRLDADVVFVGEAPGAEEDARGLPFVGRSGKLLDLWIAELGLLDNWCITNIVRCRPEDNRKPKAPEMDACWKHLRAFLGFVQPKAVVAVGSTAHTFLRRRGVPHLGVRHPSYYIRGFAGPKEATERAWRAEMAALRARLEPALRGEARLEAPPG